MFHVKFIYVDHFDEAEQYQSRRRRIPPAVYYGERLFEEPVPELPIVMEEIPAQTETQQNVDNENSIQQILKTAFALATACSTISTAGPQESPALAPAFSDDNGTRSVNVLETTSACSNTFRPNISILSPQEKNSSPNSAENDANSNIDDDLDTLQESYLEAEQENKTELQKMVQNRPTNRYFEANANEIISLLQDEQTYTFDEIEMSFVRFPKPFESTCENLTKRENDSVSGNIPFNTSVRISA